MFFIRDEYGPIEFSNQIERKWHYSFGFYKTVVLKDCIGKLFDLFL